MPTHSAASVEKTRSVLKNRTHPAAIIVVDFSLSAAQIAHQLDGDLGWQTSDGLQWVAVLRFQRAIEAQLGSGPAGVR